MVTASADHVTPAPWLSDQDVVDRVPLARAIEAVAAIVAKEARGTARAIPKTMVTWDPRSAAHALGGYDAETGRVAFKTWVNTPRGAAALLSLFDSAEGGLLATMEAVAVGQIRTASISGIATREMSSPDANELTIVGTGRQALLQVAAVAAVRPIERVRVWSPRAESREAFAETVERELGKPAVAHAALEEAVEGAPIVTVVTRAQDPFFPVGILAPGAHLNAVGAILPANAEFESDLLAGSDLTVVDTLENARKVSRELIEFYGDDWSSVRTLGQMLLGEVTRPASPNLTVFEGVGLGLGDLAVAALAVEAGESA